MIQPKIVVRNTISGRRPPAPGRREKPGRRRHPTPGRRQAHAPTNHGVSPCPREAGDTGNPGRRQEGSQGGGETPTPQGGGKLTPLPTTGYHLGCVSLGVCNVLCLHPIL